jgi:hypothetical protein
LNDNHQKTNERLKVFDPSQSKVRITEPGDSRQETAAMRDRRFVAEHRGGPLTKVQHSLLIAWACDCTEHVLQCAGELPDERVATALRVAGEWQSGNASVGDARKASVAAHAAARESSDPAAVAVARAAGHAVATAHMADHALGAAWYGLKAVRSAGRSTEAERKWQDDCLPPAIKDLVLSAREMRKI